MRRAAEFLIRYELWLVALAAAASLASDRLLPLAVTCAAVFWPLRWVACRRLTRRTPADLPIAVLVLLLPVTLWATALPELTWPQVLRLLVGIGLFYAVVNWAVTPGRLRLAASGLALGGLGLALLAPASVSWITRKLPFMPEGLYNRFQLLFSDTVHPNVMAGSLVILAPLALGLLLFAWGELPRWTRLALALASAGMIAVVFLTQSRGAWMGFAAAAALLALLRWRRAWLVLLPTGLAAIAGAYMLGFTRVIDALTTNPTLGSLDGRLEIWSRAVYMIQDFPFTGVGMGLFGPVADALYPFFLVPPGSVPHAHNLFLQVAVDLGLPGLAAWLGVFAAAAVAAWRAYREGLARQDARQAAGSAPAATACRPGLEAGLGAGLLASQAALAVHGLTDAVTWGMVRPAPLVWALWGLAFAVLKVYVRPIHPE